MGRLFRVRVGRLFRVRKLNCGGHLVRFLAVGCCLAMAMAVAGCDAHDSPAARSGGGGAVSNPPVGPVSKAQICGQPVLNSPYEYDGYRGSSLVGFASGENRLPTYGSAGADYPHVTAAYIVPPGDNGDIPEATLNGAHLLIYFEPGEHLNVPGISPGSYSVYLGGYSSRSGEATIDNGHKPGSTFLSSASHVTIEHLTIKNFDGTNDIDTWGGSIVDQYGGYDWTVDYNTVGPNGNSLGQPFTGYGIGVGSDSEYKYNCVIKNGEGGFNNGTATPTLKDPAPWGGPPTSRSSTTRSPPTPSLPASRRGAASLGCGATWTGWPQG